LREEPAMKNGIAIAGTIAVDYIKIIKLPGKRDAG